MQLPVSSAARFTSTQVESRKPRYMGIIISHCKDPYLTTSIMESNKGVFRGSCEYVYIPGTLTNQF